MIDPNHDPRQLEAFVQPPPDLSLEKYRQKGVIIMPEQDPRAGCVIADPAWQFTNKASRAAATNHYNTMTIRKIAQLPVDDWTRDNAHLFLWIVDGLLFESKQVIDAWGFRFVCSMPWIKVDRFGKLQMGLGNYLRHAHELCLFCVKGKAPALDHRQLSAFWAPRSQHSRKPDNVHAIAEKMSPGPYLEMFARRGRKDWASWGVEAPAEPEE